MTNIWESRSNKTSYGIFIFLRDIYFAMERIWSSDFNLSKGLISFVMGIILSSIITLGIQDIITCAFAQAKSNLFIGQNNKNITSIEDLEFKGDPFYTENTKSTNLRVLNIEPLPTVEVTYNGNSTIQGSATQTVGTIIDIMDENGAVHSKGKAIILIPSGKIITYTTESIGYYNPDGSFSDKGIMLFSLPFYKFDKNTTNSETNMSGSSYLEFNNVFGIYKKTVDPLGNGDTRVWKWG